MQAKPIPTEGLTRAQVARHLWQAAVDRATENPQSMVEIDGVTVCAIGDVLMYLTARMLVLEGALQDVVASRDKNAFKQEEHCTSDQGSYWSPAASMVDSEAIAAARKALEVQRG